MSLSPAPLLAVLGAVIVLLAVAGRARRHRADPPPTREADPRGE